MNTGFDSDRYLAMILPQANQQRQASDATKRAFYEQVKQYVGNKGLAAQDYEKVLHAVCDTMNF